MRFDHRKLDLTKDLNLIIGPNGSGKSSVLEALALSFQLKERGASVANYIRKGTKNATIILECDWLGKPLVIKSIFSQRGAGRKIKRYVSYDGREYEDTVANNFLSAHFKEQHNVVSFALQGSEKFITTSKAKNLQNLIDLLQIDFQKEISNIKGFLKDNYSKKETLIQNLNSIKGSLQSTRDSKVSFENEIEKDRVSLSQLVKPENDIASIEKDILETQVKLNSFQEILTNNQKKKQDLLAWEASVQKTKNEISSLEATLTGFSQEEKSDPTQLENELKTLKDNLQTKNISMRDCVSKVSSLVTQIDAENKKIHLFENGYCPTCSRKLEDSQQIEMKVALDNLLAEKTSADSIVNSLNEEISNLNTDINKKQKDINDMKLKNSEIDHSLQMRQVHLKNLEDKKNYLATAESKVEELKNNEYISLDENEKANLETKLTELISQKGNYQTWENTKTQLENKISQQLQYVENFKNTENNYVSQEAEVTSKISQIENEIFKWEKVQHIFEDIPKIHLKNVITDVNDICNDIIRGFGYKELKINLDEKGIEFILCNWPLPDVEDADIPYEMCSTFEKNLINLSFIYALANMFRVPFICIDELDANSDEANTQKLGKLILQMLKTVPVAAVSHDPNLVEEMLQDAGSVSILKMETTEQDERLTE